MLLSQSCPRPRQAHPQHPSRDTERRRRLLRVSGRPHQPARLPPAPSAGSCAQRSSSSRPARCASILSANSSISSAGRSASPAKLAAAARRFDICSQYPRVDVAGDPEQPSPGGTPAGIKTAKPGRRAHDRLRRQIGDASADRRNAARNRPSPRRHCRDRPPRTRPAPNHCGEPASGPPLPCSYSLLAEFRAICHIGRRPRVRATPRN